MNVADIFGAVHLNLETGNFEVDAQRFAESTGAKAGQSMSSSFASKLKVAFGTGGVIGVGVAAGTMAFHELGASVEGAIGFMEGAVKAAADDEASQARLQTALTENAKGWDGNTAAIEDVLKARMKLGFSDDEQRASLAILVAKTGDVTQALDIERAAMDLARLKGIDLAAATEAISKGMSGQGRALVDLGIKVKDYATANEILMAIQDKAAGQAETFANTTAGALASMNIEIDEAVKEIGYKLTPIVRDLAVMVRDDAVPAVDALGQGVDLLKSVMAPAAEEMDREKKGAYEAAVAMDALAKSLEAGRRAASGGADAMEASAQAAADLAFKAAGIDAVGAAFSFLARGERDVKDEAVFTIDTLPQLADAFRSTAQAARDNRLDAAWDLKELPLKILIAKDGIVAAAKEVNDARSAEDKRAAQLRLLEAKKNLVDLTNQLSDAKVTAAAAASGAALGDAYGGGLFGQIAGWATKVMNEVNGSLPGGTPNVAPRPVPRAAGGPVVAGLPYLVNENTPRSELFMADVPGRILTGAPAFVGNSGGGSPVIIRVEVGGNPLIDYIDEQLAYRRRR